MANVIDLSGYSSQRRPGLIARLRSNLAEYRAYQALRAELSALSDRDLDDIGISRLSIDEIARSGARR
jgi:uncharacterized protein YjiS (DUF1127 family)